MASVALKSFVGLRQSSPENHHSSVTTLSKPFSSNQIDYRRLNVVAGKSSPKVTGRNLRVAVIGGGPAGGAAAETLAKGGVETILIERKMDNAKPCGGAIPLCMVGEFDLPLDIIDRRVTKMKMISPSNVAVDIGKTLKPHEYIGMVRREILDAYLRDRAAASGATVINGLFVKMDKPTDKYAPYVIHYNSYDGKAGSAGKKVSIEVDAVIGADGANSRVAKSIDAGDYEYAIAFQERIKIPDDKMQYYEDLAEMYVGDDVSPDFYGWVFPKCDHVAVGTGTVTHKPDIKKFQLATRLRARDKILGGKIIRVEAHPIPEHPRPRRLAERVALVGDAAGYVTKCSGEGIYFAAKSGRMCAEAIVEGSEKGRRMVDQAQNPKVQIMSLMKSLGASAVVNVPTAAVTTTQIHHCTQAFPFLSLPQHLPRLNSTTTSISWRTTTSVRTAVAAANSSDTVEKETESNKKYHFVVANAKFMLDEEEHFQEQLFERVRLFKERNIEQDFWLVIEPKFLDKFPDITKRLKRPAVALVSTNGTWIKFMKLRLDRVLLESFKADSLEEALASNPVSIEFEKPDKWVAPYPKYEYGWWESFLPPAVQKQQA